jgi:magnesium-transporting ATPase (P-type)
MAVTGRGRGISVVMTMGDNERVAHAIARQVEMRSPRSVGCPCLFAMVFFGALQRCWLTCQVVYVFAQSDRLCCPVNGFVLSENRDTPHTTPEECEA